VIVELKGLAMPSPLEEAQALNYLKTTRFEVEFLLNFGNSSLEYRRLVF